MGVSEREGEREGEVRRQALWLAGTFNELLYLQLSCCANVCTLPTAILSLSFTSAQSCKLLNSLQAAATAKAAQRNLFATWQSYATLPQQVALTGFGIKSSWIQFARAQQSTLSLPRCSFPSALLLSYLPLFSSTLLYSALLSSPLISSALLHHKHFIIRTQKCWKFH